MDDRMNQLIALRCGDLTLTLAPSSGGSITGLIYANMDGRKIPCLRVVEGNLSDPLDGSNFPLVPFVNRVRNGHFRFRGREIKLVPNLDGDPSPLHGQGWKAPWSVASHDENTAELLYRHEIGEWPWTYEARQLFTLAEDALSVRLSCTNTSSEPMPCGLGLHPYFNCGPSTTLDTEVECSWTIDADVLPVDKVAASGRYDLRQRRICGQDLDHGFGGWSGTARIDDPELPFTIRLTAKGAAFLHVYSPVEGGFFATEPVTHANAALNAAEADWDELGLRVLDPGETMSLEMQIALVPREGAAG
jgi:aldose 1-epimerase